MKPSGWSLTHGFLAVGASLTPIVASGQTTTLDWDRMARMIVARIAPTQGERVLLVGVPGTADALIPPLRTALKAAGAEDLGFVDATGPAPAAAQLAGIDVGVMLPGATAMHAPYGAIQRVLTAARQSRVRTIHFHWAGAYSTSGALLDVTPDRGALYQRALLQTD